ncbi:MAG: hypothetical protein ACR2IE_17185 [Candidatus Sumerlaeaceae bacterium]
MKITTLTKAGATALAMTLAATSFGHTTCNTVRTHYTAGYDYAPTVINQGPVVRFSPVTLVAPAVAPFRTFRPFGTGVVMIH